MRGYCNSDSLITMRHSITIILMFIIIHDVVIYMVHYRCIPFSNDEIENVIDIQMKKFHEIQHKSILRNDFGN